MGFGSYEEGDQEQYENDVEDEDGEAEKINRGEEDNEVSFDFGDNDTEDLLEKINNDEDE